MTDLPTGTVTFLFTDIEGSTRLWEQHPEAMRVALARHDALLRDAIEASHGYVIKTVGDAFYAVFPTPVDSAAAAVAAQCVLQKELPQIRVRMALHSGKAEAREGDYFGPALNRVARLLTAGHGGQVLLSQATAELLRPCLPTDTELRWLGQHRLRDLPDREAIFQLVPPGLPGEFPALNTLDVAFRRGVLRAAAVAAVILAVVTGLAVMAATQAHRANQQRRLADQQRQVAEERRLEARQNLYAAQIKLTQQSWDEGNLERARQLLDAQRPEPGEEDLRGFEWRYLWHLCQQDDARSTLSGHTDWVHAIAFSPDGRTLASGSYDNSIRLWDLRGRREPATLRGHPEKFPGISSLAYSPNGNTLASSCLDGTVELWNLHAHRADTRFRANNSGVNSIAFSPDGRILATGGSDGKVNLWALLPRRWEEPSRDRRHGAEPASLAHRPLWARVATLAGLTRSVLSVKISPDGKLLAAADEEGAIKIWELVGSPPQVSGRIRMTLKGHGGYVRSIAFSPDGKMLVSGGADATVRLWPTGDTTTVPGGHHREGGPNRVAEPREIAPLKGHTAPVLAVAISPDGKLVASASGDATAKLWNMASRQVKDTFRGHSSGLFAVAFSPDSRTLATGSNDNTVKLWNLSPKPDPDVFTRHQGQVQCIAYSPDGKILASGGQDGTLRLQDIASKRSLAVWPGHTAAVNGLAFSPDGKRLATGSADRTVKLWDLSVPAGSPRMIAPFDDYLGTPWGVAFSPDGSLLARVCSDQTVKLWDMSRERGVLSLNREQSDADGAGVAFSPDSRLLAADCATGIKLWEISGHPSSPAAREVAAFYARFPLAFSPDSKTLAAKTEFNIAKVWDIAASGYPHLVSTITGHTFINSLAFSPDGKTLATGSNDSLVRLWSTATKQEVTLLSKHTAPVTAVAFSPDGNTLVSASADATVRLWRAPPFPEIDLVRGVSISGDRTVTLQWEPVPAAVGYQVDRRTGAAVSGSSGGLRGAPERPARVRGTSFTDSSPDLENGRVEMYAVRALFRNAAGRVVEGSPVKLLARPVVTPRGFGGCSINEGAQIGSVLFDPAGGEMTLRGSGRDIWNETDGCYFLHRPVAGDFQATAAIITRPTPTHEWAHAGLMVRDSLDPGARHVMLAASAAHALQLIWRFTTRETTDGADIIPNAGLKLPLLLRLIRQGSTITAAYSRDGGRSFQPAGKPLLLDPPIGKTVYVGLAITAHDEHQIAEARFSGLQIQQ